MAKHKQHPRPTAFVRGNKAAAKGKPRTVSFSCRLPESTAYKLASLAFGRCSRTDAIIELIEGAVPDSRP